MEKKDVALSKFVVEIRKKAERSKADSSCLQRCVQRKKARTSTTQLKTKKKKRVLLFAKFDVEKISATGCQALEKNPAQEIRRNGTCLSSSYE